jgi:hypothetical protein
MRTRIQEQQEKTSPSYRQAKTLGAHDIKLIIYTIVGVVPIGICKFRLKPFMIASKKPS